MVIGRKFAWGHMAKTAGDATLAMFTLFPEVIVESDPVEDPHKHDAFPQRERLVWGKDLALNMRRLPSWMLSRAQHEARHGIYPAYTPLPMATADEIADRELADYMLRKWSANGQFTIQHWLRMENLREDFLTFIARYADVTAERRQRVMDLGKRNAMEYDHEVLNWFTADQLHRMYQNNPGWAAIERRVYGDLLI